MQPSYAFDWGRVVTPARWIARILTLALVVWAGVVTLPFAFGGGGVGLGLVFILFGLVIVALPFWAGFGEILAGLALIGGAILAGVSAAFESLWLLAVVGFALAGVLLIAVGWYTLAQRSHRTPPAVA